MASTCAACWSVIGSMRNRPAPAEGVIRLRFQRSAPPATFFRPTPIRLSVVFVAERLAQLPLLLGRQVRADELGVGALELGLDPVHDGVRTEQEQRRATGRHLLANPVDELVADPDVGER